MLNFFSKWIYARPQPRVALLLRSMVVKKDAWFRGGRDSFANVRFVQHNGKANSFQEENVTIEQ
jgi:hypothetical protein